MTSTKPPPDPRQPLELKIRVLRSQLGRVDGDLERLREMKDRIQKEIDHCQKLLARIERQQRLRRVK